MFDDDTRERLAPELEERTIVEFAEPQAIFDLIEKRFPVGINRIAWERVRAKEYAEVFPVATGCKKTEEVEERLVLHRNQVRRWVESAEIAADDMVAWVGDSTDIGFRMSVETLLACFPRLFSLPQHSYVLPKDGAWCLNYVMEGELFFAKAGAIPYR